MTLTSPKEGWYFKKAAKDETIWIVLSVIVAICLFSLMVLWHVFGKQNTSTTTYAVTPDDYRKIYENFVEKNKIGEENGVPVVKPQPGGDVFMLAQQWRWEPAVVLKKGQEYRFHLSSMDVMHGFSLQPINMNYMVYPEYDYHLYFRPTTAGDYRVYCNEFCGIGHHTMITKILVEE